MSRWAVLTFFGILALAFIVGAQENTVTGERLLTISGFGGYNTADANLGKPPTDFEQLLNWDLNRNLKSLTKRYGFDSLGTIVGQDSIIGVYGAYYTDGTQQLFIVTDSAGVGYGNIYVTQLNSNVLDKDGTFAGDTLTRITTHWPIFNTPFFTTYNDRVYVVNGSGKGIVYDRKAAYPWPPNGPGEPTLVPLDMDGAANDGDTNTWRLDGEYRYIIIAVAKPFSVGVIEKSGFVSYPIRVDNGRVLLKDFQWVVSDSIDDTRDTVFIQMYRTKANPGIIDETDSAYNHTDFRLIALTQAALRCHYSGIMTYFLFSPIPKGILIEIEHRLGLAYPNCITSRIGGCNPISIVTVNINRIKRKPDFR